MKLEPGERVAFGRKTLKVINRTETYTEQFSGITCILVDSRGRRIAAHDDDGEVVLTYGGREATQS
jgi:hypothetical protein